MTERKRRVLWTLAIIIAFIIGFLLGRRYCERHTSGGSGGGAILGKGGGGGGGGGGHFAPGSGKGTSKSEHRDSSQRRRWMSKRSVRLALV